VPARDSRHRQHRPACDPRRSRAPARGQGTARTRIIETRRCSLKTAASPLPDPTPNSSTKIPPHAVVIDAQGRCVTPRLRRCAHASGLCRQPRRRVRAAHRRSHLSADRRSRRRHSAHRRAHPRGHEDELLAAARKHRDWMLRSGTTTIEAKSGYGLDRATELKMLRVLRRSTKKARAHRPTLLAAHTVPPEFAGRRESTFAGSPKS
jgi:imidazolonepropionase-like amidohydrolase